MSTRREFLERLGLTAGIAATARMVTIESKPAEEAELAPTIGRESEEFSDGIHCYYCDKLASPIEDAHVYAFLETGVTDEGIKTYAWGPAWVCPKCAGERHLSPNPPPSRELEEIGRVLDT